MVKSGDQDEYPDHAEDDAPRDHAEAPQPVDSDALRTSHLVAFEIPAESGFVGVRELTESAENADDAGDGDDHSPSGQLECPPHDLLHPVAAATFGSTEKEPGRKHRECRVVEPAPGKADA